MSYVITSLCLRDNGCMDVCPVECIIPGDDLAQQPTFSIDASTCIECGACALECPFAAIYPADEVPTAYVAKGGEYINQVGLTGHYEAKNHRGEQIVLETTRRLVKGEVVDLTV